MTNANIDKAIEIAKRIDPNIGPALDMDRKSLSESKLREKLLRFFELNKKAADVILAHPGKSFEEIKASFDANVAAHARISIQVASFVNDIFSKKSDLSALALSASRRIVLADPRIENFYKINPKIDPAATSQEISEDVQSMLVNYFENLKGRNIDQEKIIEDITAKITLQIGQLLAKYAGRK